MMRRLLPLLLLPLAACSQRETGTDGSENDFAARVGAGSAPASAVETAAALPSKAVKGPPPPNADVFQLEQLGDIGRVNLGPRAGACTFASNGVELLIAAGPADRALPGKGVVRIGGKLIELDAPPGGIEAVKSGTTFRGEGFSVAVRPGAAGRGSVTITNGEGETRTIAGD